MQPETRRNIPRLLDAIDIPSAPDDPKLTKRAYIESRLALLTDTRVPTVVENLLHEHESQLAVGEPTRLAAGDRFDLEELLWTHQPSIDIKKRARYNIAKALDGVPLYLKAAPFRKLIARLWDRTTLYHAFVDDNRASPLAQVEKHVIENEDWSTEELFDEIGAFDASGRRFALFVQGLASHEIRPDEDSQRAFVAAVNGAVSGCGVEFREIGSEGGFPVFRFEGTIGGTGRAKNLIFASPVKPDLRFRDAINNDIEIVSNADQVLVYDLPIPAHGLRWSDLQTWWADREQLDDGTAKKALYRRLLSSLPNAMA